MSFTEVRKIGRPGPAAPRAANLAGWYRLQISGGNANLNVAYAWMEYVGGSRSDEAFFLLPGSGSYSAQIFVKKIEIIEQSYNWSVGSGELNAYLTKGFTTGLINETVPLVEGDSNCNPANDNSLLVQNRSFQISGTALYSRLRAKIDRPTVTTACRASREIDIYVKPSVPFDTVKQPSWADPYNVTVTQF